MNNDSNINDWKISLDLKSNMLTFAEYILDPKNNNKYDFIDIKFKIISYATFYELFYKYIITLKEGKDAIWVKSECFDLEKHKKAEFSSKDFKEVKKSADKYLTNVNISEKENELINSTHSLRNKILHFGLCEQDESTNEWAYQCLDPEFFTANKTIVKKMFLSLNLTLKDDPVYYIIKQKNDLC